LEKGLDMRFAAVRLAIGMLLAVPGAAAAQDAAAGKVLFNGRCGACHQVAELKSGPMAPSLKGVYGRKVAALGDFAYSPALKGIGGFWTESKLDAFLSSPVKYAPGGKMLMAVTVPADRASIIAYLKSAK